MIKPIIFTGLFLYSIVSSSFTLNSSTNPNLKGWSNTDVKIYLNPTNCPSSVDVAGLIEDAVAVWNNIPNSSIKVSYGGTTSSTAMSDPPTAYCETNFQGVVGDEDSVPGAAAVNGSSGRITQGIIILNASSGLANIANIPQDVLKIIMAHEIGHMLGLGHSSSTSALMYYDASYKQQFRLSQDDLDGMAYMYPNSSIDVSSLAGCGLIKRAVPPTNCQNNFLIIFALLPLLIAVILRNYTKLQMRRID